VCHSGSDSVTARLFNLIVLGIGRGESSRGSYPMVTFYRCNST
jgi:hypothetical protein